jgi:hypothetical protein
MVTPDDPVYENNSSNWNAAHTITGATAAQIVFGAAGGGLSQSADLSWNDTTNILTVGKARFATSIGIAISTAAAATTTSDGWNGTIASGDGGSVSGAGGIFNLTTGSALGGNFGGGNFIMQSGNGHGTGVGGAYIMQSGSGGATGVGGDISLTTGNGGATSGSAGAFTIALGTSTSGAGGIFTLIGGEASGTNQPGGNIDLYPGDGTGTGAQGYLTLQRQVNAYGVALGAGVITRGVATGPAAIATAIWIPIYIDGVLTYIEGFR